MTNPFNPGYYTEADLQDAGFKSIGHNVRIARNCTIIGLENIEIGNNVRVDGYCTITAAGNGYLRLGSFIHIGSYCLLSAGDGIVLEDFVGLSHGTRIYSRSDDYTGNYLTGPTVPAKYTGVTSGEVVLKRHVIVGSGTILLPNVVIGEGTAIGALCLVAKSLSEWGVYVGCPAKRLKGRSKNLLVLEKQLIDEIAREQRSATPEGSSAPRA